MDKKSKKVVEKKTESKKRKLADEEILEDLPIKTKKQKSDASQKSKSDAKEKELKSKGIKKSKKKEESSEPEENVESEEAAPTVDKLKGDKKLKNKEISEERVNEDEVNSDEDSDDGESDDGVVDDSLEEEPSVDEGPGQGFASAIFTILSKSDDKPLMSSIVGESNLKAIATDNQARKQRRVLKEQKRLLQDKDRYIPQVGREDFEKEQKLKKTATAGVVKLFNAVKQQQKIARGPKGSLKEKRSDNLSKEKFMELLKNSDKKSDVKDTSSGDKPKWGVLSDDYMLGASMKKWKEAEEGEEEEEEESGEAMSGNSDEMEMESNEEEMEMESD